MNVKDKLNSLYRDRYKVAVVRSGREKFLLEEQPKKKALKNEKRYALTKNKILEIKHGNRIFADKEGIERVVPGQYRTLLSIPARANNTENLSQLILLLPVLNGHKVKCLEEMISLTKGINVVDALTKVKHRARTAIYLNFTKCT